MSRQPFNTRWAQSVETDTPSSQDSTVYQDPGSARIGTGWQGGADKDAPPAGQENWWHNRVDSALQGIERNGAMSWHPGAVYAAGAPTYASDGNYYESISNGNTGNDPTSTSGFWIPRGPSLFGVVPVGSMIMVAHNGVPEVGWLKCNGAVVVRATYSRLFDKIGTAFNTGGESSTQFRLPDMRGMFPRGFDDSRGIDPSRVFGSTQQDMLKAHTHDTRTAFNGEIGGAVSPGNVQPSMGNQSGSTGGAETRPKNVAVNYWIKF